MKYAIAALLAARVALTVGAAHAEINEQIAPATSAAVSALYVANDTVQVAVMTDWCSDADERLVGDDLTGENARQYDLVGDAIQYAFDATNGTDAAVEGALSDFCAWAGER